MLKWCQHCILLKRMQGLFKPGEFDENCQRIGKLIVLSVDAPNIKKSKDSWLLAFIWILTD